MVDNIFIPTFSRDGVLALLCGYLATLSFPNATVVLVDDIHDPCNDSIWMQASGLGFSMVRSHWPRHGNLNGHECVRGLLQLLSLGDGFNIKLDPDTALLNGDWAINKSLVASGDDRQLMYGCCYAMQSSLAREILNKADLEIMRDRCPEDLTIAGEAIRLMPHDCYFHSVCSDVHPNSKWTSWNYLLPNPFNFYHDKQVVTLGNPRPSGCDQLIREKLMSRFIRFKLATLSPKDS